MQTVRRAAFAPFDRLQPAPVLLCIQFLGSTTEVDFSDLEVFQPAPSVPKPCRGSEPGQTHLNSPTGADQPEP
jgi:hypothetical protein